MKNIQRELWEHRYLYLAPLAVAALCIVGLLISAIRTQHTDISPYDLSAGLIMVTTLIVGIIYSLDALYGERRDRSILFWKSMPVSDLTAVLSKACIPILVLPLLTFAITLTTHIMMFLLSVLVLWNFTLPWNNAALFSRSVMLLYHLILIHGLWYAPIFGWLLLVSAWARRAPILWASLPLITIGVFEKIAFNGSYFQSILISRIGGVDDPGPFMGTDTMMHLAPGLLLTSPGLWIGLVATAVFLSGAVYLRRNRAPI